MRDKYETLEIAREGNRLGVSLNRPDVRNAFDERMIAELTEVFEDAASDLSIRCLVIRGVGPVFCAGADVAWMRRAADYNQEENLEDARRLSRMFSALIAVDCPTVAVVQGAALGGGAGLVACTDIVIASLDAKLGFTEVRLGIAPAVISPFVMRKVPPAHARRYFATGEIFDGRRAAEIGLVSEAVLPAELGDRVEDVVSQVLAVAPNATRVAKGLVDRVLAARPEEIHEFTAGLIADLRITEEAQEGLSAFLEKRPPSWGREE